MSGVPPISACIIACDEADRIEACIASVAWCDEVLVLDSGSSDDTVARAARAGARVLETDWPGWVAQKQRAAEAATHDWIFSLDADERVDPDLRDALEDLRRAGGLAAQTKPRVYAVRRRVWFLGRWIRHGGWYPEWRVRLFHRAHAAWGGVDPHDRVESAAPTQRVHEGHLEHYTYRDLSDYLRQLDRFTAASASRKFAAGRRAGLFDVTLRPLYAFLRMYVFRAGFLDGRPGFLLAINSAYSVFMKYAKLWALHQPTHEDKA